MNIDQMIADASQAHNATGKMSAQVLPEGWVPGLQFKATSIHFSPAGTNVGVLGMMNPDTQEGNQAPEPISMYLSFPDDIADGDHEIHPYKPGTRDVWAYFASSIGEYATRGRIVGLKWNRDAGTLQADSFEFEGTAENDRVFFIKNGELNVTYEKIELTATGSGSASIKPAHEGVKAFKANRFGLNYDASSAKGVVSVQDIDVRGQTRAGISLDFTVTDGKVRPKTAVFLHSVGAYPARPGTLSITQVEHDPEMTSLKLHYDFEFSHNAEHFTVSGMLDVTNA